jgi:hypothetical protein
MLDAASRLAVLGIGVAGFPVSCGGLVSVAGQALSARRLTVDGLKLKEGRADPLLRSGLHTGRRKGNVEMLRAQK